VLPQNVASQGCRAQVRTSLRISDASVRPSQ
jgi:hypothetical protein